MKLILEHPKKKHTNIDRLYLTTDTQWKCIGTFKRDKLTIDHTGEWYTPFRGSVADNFTNSEYFAYTELDIESFMADHFELFI